MKNMFCGLVLTMLLAGANTQAECSAAITVNSDEHRAIVELAQTGQSQAALMQLRSMLQQSPVTLPMLWDYAVIAVWAEEYEEALQVYEQRVLPVSSVNPDYVTLNIAQAYFKQGQFSKAEQLYSSLASAYPQAQQWQAQCLTMLGDSQGALALYANIIEVGGITAELETGRALAYIRANNGIAALSSAERALELAAADESANINEIRNIIAGALIRNGDYPPAIKLLQPAVSDGTASLFMQADYVVALFANGDFKAAVAAGEQLWPDLTIVPVYGQRALADAYLRLGQPAAAAKLYGKLLTVDPTVLGDRHSLGFALLQSGQIDSALDQYAALLTAGTQQTAAFVAHDAEWFIQQGKPYIGTQLFKVVANRYPEQIIWRQRMGDQYNRVGLLREAAVQYTQLLEQELQPAAAAGLAYTATKIGDYKTARQAVELLATDWPQSAESAYASGVFSSRKQGETELLFSQSSDYKGNDSQLWQLTAEQRLGDRLLALTDVARRRVGDQSQTRWLESYGVGLRYLDLWQTADLWLVGNGTVADGYRWQYQRYFGERNRLELSQERRPVMDVQALSAGIDYTVERISWERQIGDKNLYSISLGQERYSDGNRAVAYDVYWNRKLQQTAKRETDAFVYYNNLRFTDQTSVYESPEHREAYGVGVNYRWNQPRSYWQTTVVAEWGRDRPEPIDFAPHVRLEYGRQLTANSSLRSGVEYGARTGRSRDSGGIHFGYRQYDLTYRLEW